MILNAKVKKCWNKKKSQTEKIQREHSQIDVLCKMSIKEATELLITL